MRDKPLKPEIVIAVCTFRRPAQLAVLLTALEAQIATGENAIVVVDNDDRESAREVAAAFSSVTYMVEPVRGIATARNSSVRRALTFAPWAIAFIDDDEVPAPDWLSRLTDALQRGSADVVTGPVVYDTSAHPSADLITDQYLRTVQRRSGDLVKYVATNNTLVRAEWLALFAFDPEFDLSGGSDLDLFLRIQRAGGTCRWVQEGACQVFCVSGEISAGYR